MKSGITNGSNRKSTENPQRKQNRFLQHGLKLGLSLTSQSCYNNPSGFGLKEISKYVTLHYFSNKKD